MSEFRTKNGADQVEGRTTFSYTDARLGHNGRGPLGFRTRTITDYDGIGSMIRTTTEEYDNGQEYDAATKSYPFAGRLSKSTTTTAEVDRGLASVGGAVSRTSFETTLYHTYAVVHSDAGRPFVVPRLNITNEHQIIDGARHLLSLGSVRFEEDGVPSFDQYGNNLYQRTNASAPAGGDEHTIVTRNWYHPPGKRQRDGVTDPTLWEVGLLGDRTVESRGDVRHTQYDYDPQTGLLERSVRAPGGGQRITTLSRDEFGNVTQVLVETAEETRQGLIHYDPLGLRPTGFVGPTGMETFVELDSATGRMLTEVDANGSATQYAYDVFGRETQVVTPTGSVTTQILAPTEVGSAYGIRRTIRDGTGSNGTLIERESIFDSRGRVAFTQATGLDGTLLTQRSYYDARGLLYLEELPHPASSTAIKFKSYHYDELGSLREIQAPGDDGATTIERFEYATRHTTPAEVMPSFGIDSARTVFVARKIDADGIASTTFSSALRGPVLMRRGDGDDRQETRISHGPFGEISSYRTAGNTMSIERDDWGRITSVSDSDLGTINYGHDAFDRVRWMQDADGSVTQYEYDPLDRLVRTMHGGGVEERFVFDRDLAAEALGEPPTENSLGRLVRAERQTPTGTYTETFRYESKPGTGDPLDNRALLERVTQTGPEHSFESRYEYYDRSARIMVQHYHYCQKFCRLTNSCDRAHMTPKTAEIRAAARLEEFFEDRIGAHLKDRRKRESFALYAAGILGDGERKSVEPIAARTCAAPKEVNNLHSKLLYFLGRSQWDDRAVRLEAARYAIEAVEQREPITTWIIDDTGFLKQGNHSVGVQRQYTDSAGKIANCQIAVSLAAATNSEQIPLDFELYLPEQWATDPRLREEARIPDDVRFETKIDLAIGMIERANDAGLPGEIILADSAYGTSSDFRNAVRVMGFDFAVGVQSHTKVVRLDRKDRSRGAAISLAELAQTLGKKDFRRVTWRSGTQAKLSSRFSFVRVKTTHDDGIRPADREPLWLVVEWPETEKAPTKFTLTTLPRRMSRKQIVRLLKERWRIERMFEDLKGDLGLDHFEGRSYPGWHHHVSVVLCCHAFVSAERARAFPPSEERLRSDHPLQRAA